MGSINLAYTSVCPLASRGWHTQTALLTLWILLIPVAFLTLPYTLRKADVRRAHLVRATVYLVAIELTIALLRGAGIFARQLRISSWMSFLDIAALLLEIVSASAVFMLLPFVIVWWFRVAKLYLKPPHALGVAIAVWLMPPLLTLWIVRSTTTRRRAIVAAALAIIGAITGFAGVLALLSTLDINF